MTTPQMHYPYTKGARIFLAPGAAERLARFEPQPPLREGESHTDRPLVNDKPVTELDARRIALLPDGWLRAEVVFSRASEGSMKPDFVADILLPQREIVAIMHGWFAHQAPGYGTDYEKAEWDATWT
ncbi:Uncharacterised protein [Mycobacteroides abscessus subsp. abscessus]|uniref:Uncharacterized protein n=1 Tax=Mycobacteroides abscessus subsp. bolletii TaxID=319705 RepID=A0A9Q7SHH9_9MYCO|nr:hypothetical protein [Mycobacteroides abscessus]SHT47478.1 Uncharacterised protein [Mycobacteroides abscessus subsp. abscessus]SHT56275.1 Uncharacterised protein [Mycobacteroides abscessus subsp. abscessus]SHU55774.1 Uncharacterised protein [Mycobacteroides abscessus subsp. bolletii]SHU73873.1 Uncharacterised protein [Mycobacteroides abscessus subsp. bolletii]SHX83268.1 Uncharacterised protein [Mycobacteroides abscessus subsp. bolletii]